MVSLTGYPMCCGASVIQNFSGDTEASRNTLIETVAKHDKGLITNYTTSDRDSDSTNRMLLVILNDTQCNNNPRTLQTLADLGFVYVARQNNGVHDSWINLFVRTRMSSGDKKYQKPKFKYPGTTVEGWSPQVAKTMYPFKKVPKGKKSPVPDPFKRVDPYNREPDYTYVLDKPVDPDIKMEPEVEISNPFGAIAA